VETSICVKLRVVVPTEEHGQHVNI